MRILSKLFRPSFFLPAVVIIFFSCQSGSEDNRSPVSLESEPVKITRIEQILCDSPSGEASSGLSKILKEYPVFSDVFFNQVIFPQNTRAIELDTLVRNYCASPAIRHLIDTTTIIFPDLKELEEKFGVLNAYFNYYFPEEERPRYFTYVSEFGLGNFTASAGVTGIGLDFFLGKDYPYYDPAVFPKYRVRTMTPDYVAASTALALAESLLPDITEGNMLDFMIRNGKVLYIASRILPDEEMYKLCLYTPEEMRWVEENELDIWSFFLDLGYFYDRDLRNFQKYISPAPASPGMPEDAPGRVANWTGFRIIEAYMKNHPEIEMSEMVADTDFQKIMDESNYKPPRKRK